MKRHFFIKEITADEFLEKTGFVNSRCVFTADFVDGEVFVEVSDSEYDITIDLDIFD